MSQDEQGEILAALAVGLSPIAPAPATRARLLDAATGIKRFAPFAGDIARHFDLDLSRARGLLEEMHGQDYWRPGEGRVILAFRDFAAGAATLGLHAGFARMRGGAQIPPHRHIKRELTYVLEGEVIDSDGQRYGPGETLEKAPQSVHSLTIGSGQNAVVATLVGGATFLSSLS